MTPTEAEVAEALRDAGCEAGEIRAILDRLQCGDRKQSDRMMERCRRQELARLHESQQRIDRLDYLRYRLRDG